MFERILQLLKIACAHKSISQPFTAGEAPSSKGDWEAITTPAHHYVVCLDCGKRFHYDWNEMRVKK